MLVTVLGIVGAWMGGVDLAGHLSQRGGPSAFLFSKRMGKI